ncbi:MAG: hydroxymethylbilane synthase [Sandaracinobacteroides sp.]
MNDHPPFRLGTRASPLAMAQAHMVAAALAQARALPGDAILICPMQTVGDRIQDRPLAEIGGKALWTKELDRALLQDDIDFAVHSMKDVETTLAPGICLAAVLPRADPRDRLIGADSLASIPPGATVGTSSPRRAAQLRNRRPDLQTVSLRGNVETRMRHISEGRAAATFLAAAGLDRLGIDAGVTLDMDSWIPAASQGIVGMTARADDLRVLELLGLVNHAPSMTCLLAERALLEGLGGSCHTSVAAHARIVGTGLLLTAELLSPDGQDRVDGHLSGTDPRAVGLELAALLIARATPAIRASLEPA